MTANDQLDQLEVAANEIKDTIGHDIYIFAPADQQFFLGDDVRLAGSVVVLRAFFRGLAASVEDDVDSREQEINSWVYDQIRKLINSGAENALAPSEDPELAVDWRAARGAVANATREKVEDSAQKSQGIIQCIFVEQGLTETQAERLAVGVCQAGMAMLAGTE